MSNIGWIIVSASTAILIGTIVIWRILQGKRSRVPPQEKRTFSQELLTLGSSFIVFGIVFSTDRLIGYSFIGAGVLLSIISAIKTGKQARARV